MARDMRECIAYVCDADEATRFGSIDGLAGGKLTPMRELYGIEDCLRWYEQSPQDDPEETGR